MDRRGFAKVMLGGLMGVHEFDPERLLWTPARKTIFIPSPPWSFVGRIEEVAIYPDNLDSMIDLMKREMAAMMFPGKVLVPIKFPGFTPSASATP